MHTHKDILSQLPEEEQQAIKRRGRELIAQEMTLRELRQSLGFSQEAVAQELGKKQDEISRLEHRTDWLISTMRNYVEAMGGELRLVAEFPDRDPVDLSTIGNPTP